MTWDHIRVIGFDTWIGKFVQLAISTTKDEVEKPLKLKLEICSVSLQRTEDIQERTFGFWTDLYQ